MKRYIEGMVVALLIAGTQTGCRRHEPDRAATDLGKNPVGVINPMGQGAGEPVPSSKAGDHEPPAAPTQISTRPPMTSMPSMPPRPSVDQTVTGAYSAPDGTKVEIAGVCKVTEDSVTCWDPDGYLSMDLEQRVKAALTRNAGYGGGANISISYKKKNRVVVVKTTSPDMSRAMRPGGFSGGIMLESVGEGAFGGGGYLQLDDFRNQTFRPGEPRVSYQARCVAADPAQHATSAFFTQMEQSPKQATLALRKGASCAVEDAGLTIVSIKKGREFPGGGHMGGYRGPMFGGQPHPEWTITVRLKNAQSKYRLSLSANGIMIDAGGRLVSQKEMMKLEDARSREMQKFYSKPHKPGEAFRQPPQPSYMPVNCYTMDGSANETYYVVNADPGVLKQLTATATRSKRIEIKGIRLDPR